MEQRVSMITLRVKNLPLLREFYEQGLGWTPARRSCDSLVFYSLGDAVLAMLQPAAEFDEVLNEIMAEELSPSELELLRNAGAKPGAVMLAQNVRSRGEVDAIVAAAEAVGAVVNKRPSETSWGAYAGFFFDPEGHLWEICFNPKIQLGPNGEFRLD